MGGRTGMAWTRMAGRRSRSLALVLSALLHLVILGWFAFKRAAGEFVAQAPIVNVELVRLPPAALQPAPATPKPAIGRTSAAPPDQTTPPRFATPAPPAGTAATDIDPGWAVDLNGPVFKDGQWPRRERPILTRCDPLKDPDRTSRACRREDDDGRAVTRRYDPQNGKDEFAREGRRNEAVRRYHELPGTAGYPGLACEVFHRC